MKTIHPFNCIRNLFGIIAMLAMCTMAVNAQQQVTQGSTRNYRITNDNSASPNNFTYSWTVSGSGNTIANATGTSADITWNAPAGTYTITMVESNGTCSTTNTFQVEIMGIPTLSFTNATSSGCADQEVNIPLTFSGSTNTTFFPLVVNYTVNGISRSITINDASSLYIPLSASDRADKDAVGNYTITIVLTSATAHNGTVNLPAPATNTNTVNDLPGINTIIAN
jgi:hypothetical protein